MSGRLAAKYTPAFSRDLKKRVKQCHSDLSELELVINLILENSAEARQTLKRRHNMHQLAGKWQGSNECHVANAGDWLVIWRVDGQFAYFQRTGTHDELFK